MTGLGTPGHTITGEPAGGAAAPRPAGPPARPARLTKNAQFRQAAKGVRLNGPVFSLQAARRPGAMGEGPRVGLTITRKIGSAVERNRMRRRLKEALRLAPDLCAAPDCDYVLIVRRAALSIPFGQLIGEVTRAFREIAGRTGRAAQARHRISRS